MYITLDMADKESGTTVSVTKNDVEYLGDFAELLLQFTKAIGYDYVDQVVLYTKDGREYMTAK